MPLFGRCSIAAIRALSLLPLSRLASYFVGAQPRAEGQILILRDELSQTVRTTRTNHSDPYVRRSFPAWRPSTPGHAIDQSSTTAKTQRTSRLSVRNSSPRHAALDLS